MASIIYNRLFNVRIVHDFYTDQFSRNDLAVTPTIETVSAMKNSGMVFRKDDLAFRIFYKVDELANSFINFKDVRLVFGLNLINVNEFLNFTNFNDGAIPYEAGKILYFTNKNAVTVNDLDYSLIDQLRPSVFTYEFPQPAAGPNDMGHIKITNDANQDVTPVFPDPDAVKPNAANRYFYQIDFINMPKGLYKFETTTDSDPTPNPPYIKYIYIDTDLARRGVFGILDILAKDGTAGSFPPIPGPVDPPITTARVYNMRFVRRTTQWKYVVVMKSGSVTPSEEFNILDTAVQPPYSNSPLVFTKQIPDIDINGYDARVFTSNALAIPFFEEAKRGLDIKKDPGLSITVLEDIAGPSLGLVSGTALETEIFVFI